MRIDTSFNRTFYVSDCVNIDCGYCRNVVIDGFKYIKPLQDNNDADIKYWVGVNEYDLTSFLNAPYHPKYLFNIHQAMDDYTITKNVVNEICKNVIKNETN